MFTLQWHDDHDAGSAAARSGGRLVRDFRDEHDVPCAFGYAGDGWWAMTWPGRATFRFDARSPVVHVWCAPDADRTRLEDTCRRSVVPLALQVRGYQTLHASAVSIAGRTVAFCGERRSGKSTLAFALQREGCEHRADDTLVLSVRADGVTTCPLPFTPRLRENTVRWFEAADPRPVSASPPEALAAIFVLDQSDSVRTCQVETVNGGAAFQAVLAHAHCFDPADVKMRRRLVEHCLELAAAVPVLRLVYPRGLDALPSMVDGVLTACGASAGVSR